MYGRDDDEENAIMGPGSRQVSSSVGGAPFAASEEEYELFGAAAAVDTQTAASSQWIKSALDRESNNFLEYVKNSINEKIGDELGDDVFDDARKGEESVTFEDLFDPEQNTAIVAIDAEIRIRVIA